MAATRTILALPSAEVGHLATASLTNADSGYPASLACDFSTGDTCAKPAKSTAFTDTLLLDFGSAQRVDLVSMWLNAFEGVNITVGAGATTAASDWTTTFAAPAKRKSGFTRKLFVDMTALGSYSTSGRRYLAVTMATNSEAPGFKVQAFSTYIQLEKKIKKKPHLIRLHNRIRHQTEYGHQWLYDLKGAHDALSSLQINPSDNDRDTLFGFFEDCGGGAVTTVVLDPTVNEALICRLMEAPTLSSSGSGPVTAAFDMEMQSQSQHRHLVSFGVEELTAGLPEWT